ncbi:MAG TPA: aminotransferase class III-fold pyridoxal phosphate-dependent enzyme, partial [Burkholderiales bacterium]|nr:aminotransferase class III-fold pyridoxal phosphate-dependent enzyme [Burkholderiales bacterium]
TTIDTMKDEGLLANALQVGDAIRGNLSNALQGVRGVVEVRGMGMMIGVELDRPCGELVARALEAGLVINVTAENVIRILPALVMSPAEARELVERLVPLVRDFLARPAAQPKAAAAA